MADYPPEKTFVGYFNEDISSISNLKGSGRSFMGHDIYIRFNSNMSITPKHSLKSITIELSEPKEFFLGKFGDDFNFLDAKDLTCQFDPGEREAANSDGQWFCYSASNKVYWFRNWWIS